MFTAKDIVIKPIDSESARKVVRLYHYSGTTAMSSQIHFGVFLDGRIEGALQFGPSIDKRRMAQNLRIGFNDALELNRMALSDRCPKNSESRAISICLNILRKRYPHLKVIISFADACQCGDGTIYRASGFKLHSFKKNTSLFSLNGNVVSDKTLNNMIDQKTGKRGKSSVIGKKMNLKPLDGYQMKYLYFFDKNLEKQFKLVDFNAIPKEVKMYKGQRASSKDIVATEFHSVEGGENPTDALQLFGRDQ